MIPKFKAFLKETKQIVDVETIHFELGVVKVNGIELYHFEDIILMQSTGIYDKHGSVDGFKYDVPMMDLKDDEYILEIKGNIHENPELMEDI